jgi:trimeric autotransporter adhesin
MDKKTSTAGLCIAFVIGVSCDSAPPPETWRLNVAPHSPVVALPKVNAVVLADFNADGRPDLAAVNGSPGELLVLINRTDGKFEALPHGSRTTIGPTASGLVAGDLNGDKKTDLVVSVHDRDEVAVLIGKGDGTFDSPNMQKVLQRSSGNPHIHNLAMTDINGDGHQDIIVQQADDNLIAWAFGDGTGALRPSERTLQAGQHPYTITIADFNGDKHPDCASPNAVSNDLTIGLNDGSGNFSAPAGARMTLPPRTLGLAAGDLNADGRVDLVSNSDENQNELTLFFGDGRGGFSRSMVSFAAPARCYSQLITDIDGDGKADLVAPCIDRSSVLVWLAENPAEQQFRRVEFETSGTDSQVMAIGDVNGDGVQDVVTAGWAKPTIAVLLGSRTTAD